MPILLSKEVLMRYASRYAFLVVAWLVFLSGGFASFEDIGWTMRSKAMGNAIFGDFDGVNTMHYNPATISMARSIQLYTG